MPILDGLPMQTFKRLPNYYNYLRTLAASGVAHVPAPAIAREMGLNEVQVRKDLAVVSRVPGKPRIGFEVAGLMDAIADCLGYNNREDAVLVGAGKLGMTLLSYSGFEAHGVRIVAAFDIDRRIVEAGAAPGKIFHMNKLPSLCQRLNVHIGIIAVPADAAQEVCDILVQNGIRAIWNFAPIHLSVPKNVLVQNEDMAVRLALLSRHLQQTKDGDGGRQQCADEVKT